MAACCIQIADKEKNVKLLNRCVEYSTEAINLDPNNIKGYYRRGQAYSRLGEYDKAESDFKRGLEISPQNTALQKELTNSKQQRTQDEKRLKKMYSNMFS
jgi:tetratricopeptide (TPR) repeat protein